MIKPLKLIAYTLMMFCILHEFGYAGTIESDMANKVISYRLNSVEKSRVNVYVNRHYTRFKRLNNRQYVAMSAIEICKRTEYAKGRVTPYDVYLGKANCQGYSFMFYMMMAKANIPCRLVHNEKHMWNEVMLDGKWVKYDVTAMDNFF